MSIRNTLGLGKVTSALSLLVLACSSGVGDEESLGSVSEALMASWDTAFSDANGWTAAKYYATIRLADVSNDGRADVCGRGSLGVNCGVSSGSSFATPTLWSSAFSDANGWGSVQYYSTLRFPNVSGTGGKDVCGRGSGGISCAVSSGSGFGAVSVW